MSDEAMAAKFDLFNLHPDLIAMVTSYLPDKDKLKLIDIFPHLCHQIKSLEMVAKNDEDLDTVIALIKRLKNIKFLHLSDWNGFHGGDRIRAAILASKRRHIHNYHTYFWSIDQKVEYLKRIIDWDPNFDTNQLEPFNVEDVEHLRQIGFHTKVTYWASSNNFNDWVTSCD